MSDGRQHASVVRGSSDMAVLVVAKELSITVVWRAEIVSDTVRVYLGGV